MNAKKAQRKQEKAIHKWAERMRGNKPTLFTIADKIMGIIMGSIMIGLIILIICMAIGGSQ